MREHEAHTGLEHVRQVAHVGQTGLHRILAIVLLFGICSCDDEEAKRKANAPPSGSAFAHKILMVSSILYDSDDYNHEQKGWETKTYPAFQDIGIDIEWVRTLDAHAAPGPGDVCPYVASATCNNCTAFWSDPDLALQYCGVRLQLAMYIYRYKSNQGLNYDYHDIRFYVGPGAAGPGSSTTAVGIYSSVAEDPAQVDTLGLYNGAFVFANRISETVNTIWSVPFNQIAAATRDLIGHVQAHEFGHMLYGLEEARYDSLSLAVNAFHNLNFDSPRECVMGHAIKSEQIWREGYAQFCRDGFPDGNQANTCKDNMGR